MRRALLAAAVLVAYLGYVKDVSMRAVEGTEMPPCAQRFRTGRKGRRQLFGMKRGTVGVEGQVDEKRMKQN